MSQKSRNNPIIIIETNNDNIILNITSLKNIDNKNILKAIKNYLLKKYVDYPIKKLTFSESMIYDISNISYSKEYLNEQFKKLVKIYNNSNYFNFNKNIPINLLLNILENDNIDVFCLRIIISWSTDDQKEKLYDVLKDINVIDTYETSDGIYLFFESYDEIINNMFYIQLNINSSMICYTYENYTLNVE